MSIVMVDVNNMDEEEEHVPIAHPIIECILYISCLGEVTASPREKSDYDEILILDRYHCHHCTHGDLVNIQIVSKPSQKNDSRLPIGIVHSLIKSTFLSFFHEQTILCTADTSKQGLMIPLNSQLPKIFICRAKQPIKDFSKGERDPAYIIKTLRYLDNQTVFQIKIVRKQDVDFDIRITNGSFFPRGRVERISRETSLALLGNTFDIEPKKPRVTPIEPRKLIFSREKEKPKFCFTIDTNGCKCMDDAFSLNFDETATHITFGVHVADVSLYVQYENERDEPFLSTVDTPDGCAFINANSVYSKNQSYGKVIHMLPEDLVYKLSIDVGKTSDVVSIYLTIDKSTGEIVDHKVKREQVLSMFKLTYDEADVLAKESLCPPGGEGGDVAHVIKKMHESALTMRECRLGIRRWLPQKPLNIGSLVVEEFMIQTNGIVGKIIKSRFKDNIPVCVQKSSYSSVDYSHVSHEHYEDHVLVQKNAWSSVFDAVNSKEFNEAKRLFESWFHLDPLVHYVPNVQYKKKSEYRVLAKCKLPSRHPETNLDPYVHFTSPIRRYIDIVVHRLLLSAEGLSDELIEYPATRLAFICNHCNFMKTYKKDLKTFTYCLDKANEFSQEPEVLEAMVCEIQCNSISVYFPRLDKSFSEMSTLHYRHMSLCNFEIKDGEVTFYWSHEIYDYNDENWKNKNFDSSTLVRFSESDYLKMVQWLENFSTDFMGDHWDEFRWRYSNKCSQDRFLNLNQGNGADIEHGSFVHIKSLCSIGQLIKVQVGSVLRRSIECPSVQVLHLSENFFVCLEHQIDAFLAFGVSTNVVSKKFLTFTKVVEYQKYWVPLVNMAAVHSAVYSKTNIRIVNVAVEWILGDDRQISCNFELTKRFCVENQIYFNKSFQLDTSEDTNEVEREVDCDIMLDYFCIEVPCEGKRGPFTWMAHCTSTHVDKNETGFVWFCSWQPTSETKVMPPESIFEEKQNCTIEIFATQIGERRAQEMLFNLKNASPLTIEIALRKLENYNRRLAHKGVLDFSEPLDLNCKQKVAIDNSFRHQFSLIWGPPDRRLAHKFDLEVSEPLDLNCKQKAAIESSFQHKFSLIWGPPGTGKTRTAIWLAQCFIRLNKIQYKEDKKKRVVLYCAQSNKAVDVAAKMFLKCNQNAEFNILRVYGRVIEDRVFKMPFHKNRNNPDSSVDSPPNICMHNRIRNVEGCSPSNLSSKQVVESYDNVLQATGTCFFEEISKKITSFKNARKVSEKWELENADILFMTCISATKHRLQIGADNDTYTVEQVIVDEAGMCSELETLLPISQTQCSQVVLVGDHKQLAPIVKCRALECLKMGRSLFETYVNKRSLVVMLEEQYRMHEKIMAFPSQRFYHNKLKLGNDQLRAASDLSIWPDKSVPISFYNCTGFERQTMITTHDVSEMSYSNEEDAKITIDIAFELVKTCEVSVSRIVIITPYRQQLKLIQQLIKGRQVELLTNLKIITIVKSQGDEWDYVIFSTVRSKSESYVVDKRLGTKAVDRQINVALTRAKLGLFIIGNEDVLSANSTWKSLISHYKILEAFCSTRTNTYV